MERPKLKDRNGICFDQAILRLPRDRRTWQKVVSYHPEIMQFRLKCAAIGCFACGTNEPPLEIHHLIGAARRIDKRTNLTIICRHCHNQIEGRLARLLFAKWSKDRWGTDWVQLALIRGSLLPVPDDEPFLSPI